MLKIEFFISEDQRERERERRERLCSALLRRNEIRARVCAPRVTGTDFAFEGPKDSRLRSRAVLRGMDISAKIATLMRNSFCACFNAPTRANGVLCARGAPLRT